MDTKKLRYHLFANLIFLLHIVVVFVILFGWHFPSLYLLYLICLSVTLLSEIALGYCILTKWEFALRKKLVPDLNYNWGFFKLLYLSPNAY